MNPLKKISYCILGMLILYTVFMDLTLPNSHDEEHVQIEEVHYQIRKVKVEPGDTLLSITESIHKNNDTFKVNQVLHDFKQLNPQVDPYLLKENTFYYFPYYQ